MLLLHRRWVAAPPRRPVAVAAGWGWGPVSAPPPPLPVPPPAVVANAETAARPFWAPPAPRAAPKVVVGEEEEEHDNNKAATLPLGRVAFDVLELIVELIVVAIVFRWLIGSAMSARSQSGGVFDLLKSKTTEAGATGVKFADVAGNAQAKQELEEMVDFLKAPEKYLKLGARIPKGLLLTGPPGCGKTLLAKAVAGEAGVPFFAASGAEFLEMFVGVGASRMRDLFKKAKEKAPCIIFIDEVDAIGKSRAGAQAPGSGGSDEREQTLNQLLIEMDGFATDRSVLVIAATNRPDVLDDALLRPGRFDRKVAVERPDRASREAILAVHTRNKPLAKDVVLSRLAAMAPGFSGADLENWANEAAMDAARRGADAVDHEAFSRAFEHLVLGPQRKQLESSYLNSRRQRIVAYHEAGHALAGMLVENYDRLRRVTILSRGASGGATYFEPSEGGLPSRDYLRNQIVVAMGGRVAEELVLGPAHVTAGAHADLRHATDIARRMVAEYGFSDALGKMNPTDDALLGRGVAQDVARETRALLDACYTEARELLTVNEPLLHRIAEELLKHETLDEEALLTLFRGMACGVR